MKSLYSVLFMNLVVKIAFSLRQIVGDKSILGPQVQTITVLFLLICFPPIAYGETPVVGDDFPDLIFEFPSSPAHTQYLNLKEKAEDFKLSQIGAQAVIVEIFSMYCPHCQREAPTLNDLYQRIEATPELSGKLKLIGIGAGNSAFEVDYFRKQYQIPFPLFPDGEFIIHKRIGEVRTPYFFGLHIREGQPPQVFFSRLGGEKDAGKLLEELIQMAGLE